MNLYPISSKWSKMYEDFLHLGLYKYTFLDSFMQILSIMHVKLNYNFLIMTYELFSSDKCHDLHILNIYISVIKPNLLFSFNRVMFALILSLK